MTEQQVDTREAAQLTGVLIKNIKNMHPSRHPEVMLGIKTKTS